MKNRRIPVIASSVVIVSLRVELAGASLKPTPAGSSKYRTLAYLFHALGLSVKVSFLGLKMKGPFSRTIPLIAEQPGPPVSTRSSGSLVTSFWDSCKT